MGSTVSPKKYSPPKGKSANCRNAIPNIRRNNGYVTTRASSLENGTFITHLRNLHLINDM